MKKLPLSLFLIVGIFFAPNLFSQNPIDCPDLGLNTGDICDDGDPNTINDAVTDDCVCMGIIFSDYVAIDDFRCINEGDELDLNVLDNDENFGIEIFFIETEGDECFFIEQEGEQPGKVHYYDPNAPCCGTHTFDYTVCSFDGGPCYSATVTIEVKCPKPSCSLFNLMDFQEDLGDDGNPGGPGDEGGPAECISVCDSSNTTFYVPYNSNNTYVWTVISNGGSWAGGANDAEINVLWGPTGSTASGDISLVIKNASGDVVSTISLCVNIMEGPTADFTSDGYVCLDTPMSFTNTSLNEDEFIWDFGDGPEMRNITNPTHKFTTPGTHTVTLYATQLNYDLDGNQLCCCTDSISKDVVVDSLPGPNIYWISTLCQGDSSKYWTDATNCSNYDWSVTNTNGDIVPFTFPGQDNYNDTICVSWPAGFDGIISLAVNGCNVSYCTNPTTVTVPIIPSVSQIDGPIEVCINSTHVYSVPKWISAEYIWTVLDSIGNPVPFTGQGEHQIIIDWTAAGVSSIHVEYQSDFLNGTANHSGTECSGVADLDVNAKPFFELDNPMTVVCNGSTSFVNATITPSDYTWAITPSTATLFPIPNPNSVSITWDGGPGTYTLTATPNDLSVFCNSVQTKIFQVIELPPPLSIAGPDSICAGEAVLYTVNSSETGVGYSWTVIGGAFTPSNSNSILVTWAAGAGSVSVYQYLLSEPYCSSDAISLDVIEKSVIGPLSITGTAACTNSISTYTLTPAQIDDANITWSINGATDGSVISGQGTDVVQVQWNNDPGIKYVKVDVEVCGNIVSDSLAQTLFSPIEPVITQNGILCPGVTATLETGAGFAPYLWSTGDIGNTTVISTGGNYSVTTVDINGCSATAYFEASEVPGPVASISSGDSPVLCIDDVNGSVNIVAQDNQYYNFEWFCIIGQGLPIQQVSTTASFVHPNTGVVQSFQYYFNVIDSQTGCTNTSDVLNVNQIDCLDTVPPCLPQANSISFNANYTNFPFCDNYTFTPILSNASVGSWSFGDGNGSTVQTPSHQYGIAGCYNVVLTALVPNIDGSGFCQVLRDTSVCVPVAAAFSFEYLGCDSVQFNDFSTFINVGNISNPIVSWSWTSPSLPSFSTLQNPKEKFGPGTHGVTLEVTTLDGCKATVTKNIEIGSVNINSIAASSILDPPCVGDSIAFSTDAPGAVDWFWDFGDGATFSGAGPFHSYTSAGTYSVVLTVTNANGCMDTDSISILVNLGIPDGLAIVPGNTIICDGDSLAFTAPAGYSYLWSPDGQTTQSIFASEEGEYAVIITDVNGCFKELDGSTLSLYPAPVAAISGNPVICDGGCTNLFAQQSASVSTYAWTNGSGFTGGNTPQLTVCSGGIDNPYTLTITDTNGCSDTSDPIDVEVAISPIFVVDISPDPCEGKPITLTVNPDDSDVNYNWSNGQTGTSIVVFQAGTYTAIGTNLNSGCSHSSSATIHPLPDLCLVPVGCYESCPDTICGPLGLASYQWLLDGAPIPGVPGMEHCVIATVSGNYQLAATTDFGCADTSGTLILEVLDCDSVTCENLTVSSEFIYNTGELSDSCCVALSYSGNSFDLVGMEIRSNDAELLFDIGSINAQLQPTGSGTNFIGLASIVNGVPIPGAIPDFIEFCFGEVTNNPQTVIIDWFDFAADTVCSDTLIFNCPVEPDCTYLQSDSIYCDENQQVLYDITICNPHNGEFPVGYIDFEIYSPTGIIVTPPNINLNIIPNTPIQPGSCQTFTLGLSGNDIAGDTLCYNILSHEFDPNIDPTTPCCALDTMYYVEIPICDPCEFVGVYDVVALEEDSCCYSVLINNNFDDDFFDEIAVCVLSPSTTMTVENPPWSGWYTQGLTSTSVSFIPIDGSLEMGIIELPKICISTEVAPDQSIEIKWLKEGEIECSDSISVFCEPDCGYLFDDSVTCVQGGWEFSSYLKNMSEYTIDIIDITFDNGMFGVGFALGPILPGDVITTPIDFIINGTDAMAGDSICFTVTLHDQSEQGNHLTCCNFRYCIVLPECDLDLECLCEPEFELFEHVQSGITCTQDANVPNLYTFQLTDYFYFQDCDMVRWDFADGTIEYTFGGEAITHLNTTGVPSFVCVEVRRMDDNGITCSEAVCKGISDNSASNFLIYPNPSSGMINILSQIVIDLDMMVEIRDVNNRPVFNKEILSEYSDTKIEIDIAKLSSGMYFIHFITSENHWVEKISKQ